MINEFVEKWNKYNKELEQYIAETEQKEYDSYQILVELLVKYIINRDIEYDMDKYDIEDMHIVDDGDYQGTQIFILHKDCYQPSIEDYIYTNNYYGSCSGCDTLFSINEYEDGLPSKEQVKEYMQLLLNLLQKFKSM